MCKKIITILTIPSKIDTKLKYYSIVFLKNLLKKIFYYILPKKNRKITSLKYGGHYAVTRSIIEGFKKNNISYNYNPSKKNISDVIYVPGGIEALKYAIELKKQKKIKKLIAGPNIAVFPEEIIKINNYNQIDLFIQPSEWAIKWWKNIFPDFPIKLRTWYAGVNTDFWNVNKRKNIKKNIALYKKRVPEDLFMACKNYLEDNDFNVEIIYYGLYTINNYKKYLERNSCIVHFVDQESQGISLAEAWSTNTPTIVWNPGIFSINKKKYNGCSSSPYLTKDTGEFFKDINDFKNIFKNWNPEKYNPRKWVIENMSDEVSTNKLIEIINN